MQPSTWQDLFRIGMQCGLTPNQVLDMNLPMFQACIQGYEDHLFDLKCIAVSEGFWAGYYVKTKHPKPVSFILEKMYKDHLSSRKKKKGKVAKPDVDVDRFLEQEQRFQALMNRSEQHGRRES